MIPYFQDLGERVEKAWLQHSYNEEIFPQIALDLLKERPPTNHIETADILNWLFDPPEGLLQPNSHKLFGEPPVLLFQAPRFYIEALFWLAGTTDIHEHAFSGAFTVLSGSSVHSHWRFSHECTVNSRMQCGLLDRASTEILRTGDARPIVSGASLIHQLFHLELPSITIVVRTYGDRNHLPQFRYLPPGLAIDPDDSDGLRTRRLLLLNAMAREQIGGLREHALRLIENCDLETLYYLFATLTRRIPNSSTLQELYHVARARHGEIVDLFHKVCDNERRTQIIVSLRSKIAQPEARFLLALLMLMPDRESIFEAIRLQFPDDEPLSSIETWIQNGCDKSTIGFEFSDANRLIFRSLVEGMDERGLLNRMKTQFRSDSIERHCERVISQAKQIVTSDLFQPLFSISPLRNEAQIT
jgi:hypothetical protein